MPVAEILSMLGISVAAWRAYSTYKKMRAVQKAYQLAKKTKALSKAEKLKKITRGGNKVPKKVMSKEERIKMIKDKLSRKPVLNAEKEIKHVDAPKPKSKKPFDELLHMQTEAGVPGKSVQAFKRAKTKKLIKETDEAVKKRALQKQAERKDVKHQMIMKAKEKIEKLKGKKITAVKPDALKKSIKNRRITKEEMDDDVKHYIGGFSETDQARFNIHLAKKVRNGEELTEKEQRTLESVRRKTKGQKTPGGKWERASHMADDIDLKPGDIVENKHPSFFARGEHSADDYLTKAGEGKKAVKYNVKGSLRDAMDLYDYGKRGQSLLGQGQRFRVKKVEDKLHQTWRDKEYGGPNAGVNYKDVILEQMSEAEFKALPAAEKKKVIKHALSVIGAGAGVGAASKKDN